MAECAQRRTGRDIRRSGAGGRRALRLPVSQSPTPDCRDAMTARPAYSLGQLSVYFLKLGGIGFGGPVARAGYRYHDFVAKRHWITYQDYQEVLTPAQPM